MNKANERKEWSSTRSTPVPKNIGMGVDVVTVPLVTDREPTGVIYKQLSDYSLAPGRTVVTEAIMF